MTDDSDLPERIRAAVPRRRRWTQAAAETGAVLFGTAIVAGLGVHASRQQVAVALAEQWLADQGIPGVLSVERLDASGFSGSLRIGDEDDPDLRVERIEVDLTAEPAWSDTPFALTTRAIRLTQPRLKAEIGPGGLTFGRLDPVVRDFLARPPTPGARSPLVLIDDGAIRLATEFGSVELAGSGVIDDGRLVRFDGRTAPARLTQGDLRATLNPGTLRVRVNGERLTGLAMLDVRALSYGEASLEGGGATLSLDAPYPKGPGSALAGPLRFDIAVRGDIGDAGGVRARSPRATLAFRGETSGPLATPTLIGRARLSGGADRLDGQGLAARAVSMRASASRMTLARDAEGGRLSLAGEGQATASRVESAAGLMEDARLALSSGGLTLVRTGETTAATGPVTARLATRRYIRPDMTMGDLTAEARTSVALLDGAAPLAVDASVGRLTYVADGTDLPLADVRARFAGTGSAKDGFRWTATGAASARDSTGPADVAALTARVPVLNGETSHKAALDAAFESFSLTAPALSLAIADGRTTVASQQPVRMASASGARFTFAGVPLLTLTDAGTAGVLALTAEGGGLPTATLALDGWRMAPGGAFDSPVRLTASGLDAAIARDATVTIAGQAALRGGGFTFDAAGCAPVTAAEIEFGEDDLVGATGLICPVEGSPLVATDASGYRLRGAFRQGGIAWPVSEAAIGGAAGSFDARGDAVALTDAEVRVAAATATDAALEQRYEPIRVRGGVRLADGVWRGRFTGATAAGGFPLGYADVIHADATGEGGLIIDARGIAFAEGALQPGLITPLAAQISTGATGTVDFTGRVDWRKGEEATSSGAFVTRGLNFTSPAGAVSEVTADIGFVSLTPLISAPDQRVTVRQLDALTDITDLVTVFTLLEEEIRIASTEFAVAGGRVRFEPLIIPLKPDATYTGALVVDGVQLGELVAVLNLADSMTLDAVVDGRIPFEIGPGRVRFIDGKLASRRPGRLEIKRSALTGVSATGAAEVAAPGAPVAAEAPVNAIQDFAYQAMENLTFSSLELSVNSLPEGRLGLLFKVRGEHDPEVAEEARVGILDALLGRAFDRRIPLPKGTPVNLTLDTTLNFDDLLQAWLDIARRRAADNAAEASRSTPVQPPSPTETP